MAKPSRFHPTPFSRVEVTDSFWAPRIKTNREVTIPIEYEQLKSTGRVDAFHLDWKPGQPNEPHIFWDSDVAKWLEAASYSLASNPDPKLDSLLDETIDLIARAQGEDGYLNVHFTVVRPEGRFQDLRDAHELYCAGHLFEAAAAHHYATGKTALLDVARRYADYIAAVFGRGDGQKRGYCGHPEIELALVKLAEATGDRRYYELARYFVDERGQKPLYWEVEREARDGDPGFFEYARQGRPSPNINPEYNQSHRPVREQDRVVGHAVRAMYLYSAMADIAREESDTELNSALGRLWTHLTTRLMYLTGGIGSSQHNEGFTADYDLPNREAYCETCASIGLVFWAWRLVHLDDLGPNGEYIDIMERALYNGVISGVSLSGEKFFYVNPLESRGDHFRQGWFSCSCCPPNIARLLASFAGYIYSEGESDAAVHLYVQSEGKLTIGGKSVTISQKTDYPWKGEIEMTVSPESPAEFGLWLRLPAWAKGGALSVNGEAAPIEPRNGYVEIRRLWSAGDKVSLAFEMPVERVYASPKVGADLGRVALQRGPVVYCLEGADNDFPLNALELPKDTLIGDRFEPELLGGVVILAGAGLAPIETSADSLYEDKPPLPRAVEFRAVPYCVWENRQPGEMLVWLRER